MTTEDGYSRLPQAWIDDNPCPEENLDRDSLLAALVAVCDDARRERHRHEQNRQMQNLFAKQFGD